MQTIFGRRLLATAGMLVWLVSTAAADELLFSGIERRLSSPERSSVADPAVLPVAFLAEVPDENEGELPVELGIKAEPPTLDAADCLCDGAGCTQCQTCTTKPPLTGVYHVDVQLMFLRSHVMENAIGKLSEKFELSPRFIIGYEDTRGVGTRIRYWTYGRWTPNLDDPADQIRFEMNVMDVEATSRFRTEHTDVVFSGGMRWADMEIAFADEDVEADMPGMTVAADLRIAMCRQRCREWALLGGARWSVLGGDWEGDGGFIGPARDDNITVQELYSGVEYICACGDYDLYARLLFEIQNWHSDIMAQDAGTDSVGFIGPGFEFGITF